MVSETLTLWSSGARVSQQLERLGGRKEQGDRLVRAVGGQRDAGLCRKGRAGQPEAGSHAGRGQRSAAIGGGGRLRFEDRATVDETEQLDIRDGAPGIAQPVANFRAAADTAVAGPRVEREGAAYPVPPSANSSAESKGRSE